MSICPDKKAICGRSCRISRVCDESRRAAVRSRVGPCGEEVDCTPELTDLAGDCFVGVGIGKIGGATLFPTVAA